jgi:hypothetical protein
MNFTNLKPDEQFLEAAQLLKALLDKHEGSKRPKERKFFESFLQKKFETAFDLSADRKKLAYNFYFRFINTDFSPNEKIFDHQDYYQRGRNLVIVSQPYVFKEAELNRWEKESGASITIANEWGLLLSE